MGGGPGLAEALSQDVSMLTTTICAVALLHILNGLHRARGSVPVWLGLQAPLPPAALPTDVHVDVPTMRMAHILSKNSCDDDSVLKALMSLLKVPVVVSRPRLLLTERLGFSEETIVQIENLPAFHSLLLKSGIFISNWPWYTPCPMTDNGLPLEHFTPFDSLSDTVGFATVTQHRLEGKEISCRGATFRARSVTFTKQHGDNPTPATTVTALQSSRPTTVSAQQQLCDASCGILHGSSDPILKAHLDEGDGIVAVHHSKDGDVYISCHSSTGVLLGVSCDNYVKIEQTAPAEENFGVLALSVKTFRRFLKATFRRVDHFYDQARLLKARNASTVIIVFTPLSPEALQQNRVAELDQVTYTAVQSIDFIRIFCEHRDAVFQSIAPAFEAAKQPLKIVSQVPYRQRQSLQEKRVEAPAPHESAQLEPAPPAPTRYHGTYNPQFSGHMLTAWEALPDQMPPAVASSETLQHDQTPEGATLLRYERGKLVDVLPIPADKRPFKLLVFDPRAWTDGYPLAKDRKKRKVWTKDFMAWHGSEAQLLFIVTISERGSVTVSPPKDDSDIEEVCWSLQNEWHTESRPMKDHKPACTLSEYQLLSQQVLTEPIDLLNDTLAETLRTASRIIIKPGKAPKEQPEAFVEDGTYFMLIPHQFLHSVNVRQHQLMQPLKDLTDGPCTPKSIREIARKKAEEGIKLFRNAKFAESLAAHKEHLQLSRRLGDITMEAQALGNCGNAELARDHFEQALELHTQHLEICIDTLQHDSLGSAAGNLGVACCALKRYILAITYHRLQLDVCRNVTHDTTSEGKALSGIGNVYLAHNNPRQAVLHYQKHLVICQKARDAPAEAVVWCRIGHAFSNLNELERAEEAYVKYEELSTQLQDAAGIKLATSRLTDVRRQLAERQTAGSKT